MGAILRTTFFLQKLRNEILLVPYWSMLSAPDEYSQCLGLE